MPFDYKSLSDPQVASQVLQPATWDSLSTTDRAMAVETLRGLASQHEPEVLQQGWDNLSAKSRTAVLARVDAQLNSMLGDRLTVVTNEGYVNPAWKEKQARIEAGDASAHLLDVPQYIGRETRKLMDPQSEANYNELLARLEPKGDIPGASPETMKIVRDWESRPFRSFTDEGLWQAYKKYGEGDFRIRRALEEEAAIRYYIPDSRAEVGVTLDSLEKESAFLGVSAREAIEQDGFGKILQQAGRTWESVVRSFVGGAFSIGEMVDDLAVRTGAGISTAFQGRGFVTGFREAAGTGALAGLSESIDPESRNRLAEMAFSTPELGVGRTVKTAVQIGATFAAGFGGATVAGWLGDAAKATAAMTLLPVSGREEGENALNRVPSEAVNNLFWGGVLTGVSHIAGKMAAPAVATAEKKARWNFLGLFKNKAEKAKAAVGEVNGTAAKVGSSSLVEFASKQAEAINTGKVADKTIPSVAPAISKVQARRAKAVSVAAQPVEDLDPNSLGNLTKALRTRGEELQQVITSHPAFETQLTAKQKALEEAVASAKEAKAWSETATPEEARRAQEALATAQQNLANFPKTGRAELTSSLMQDASSLLDPSSWRNPTREQFISQFGDKANPATAAGQVPASYQAMLDSQAAWNSKYQKIVGDIDTIFKKRDELQKATLQKWELQDSLAKQKEESSLVRFAQEQNLAAEKAAKEQAAAAEQSAQQQLITLQRGAAEQKRAAETAASKQANQQVVDSNIDELAREGALKNKTYGELIGSGMLPSEALKIIKAQQMAKARELLALKNSTEAAIRTEVSTLGEPASTAIAKAQADTNTFVRTLKTQSQFFEEASDGILDVTKAMRRTDLRTAEGKALKEELTEHLLNLDAARRGHESLVSIAAGDMLEGAAASKVREAAILQKALTLPESMISQFLTEASKLSSLSKTSRERLARLGRAYSKGKK